jgi:hypothetical protein
MDDDQRTANDPDQPEARTPDDNDRPQPLPPHPLSGGPPGSPRPSATDAARETLDVGPSDGVSKRRATTVALVVLAAVVLIAGAAAGAAVFLLRGSSDQLAAKVPADVDVFATAYLDPAASQKMNLFRMMDRFPAIGSDERVEGVVDGAMDEVLRQFGLNHGDVRPWLGSQVAAAVRLNAFAGEPEMVLLIDSDNEAAARAALAKLRTGGERTWTEAPYQGVQVATGAGSLGSDTIVTAYVDGTVVVANATALVHDVIDVADGADPLAGSANFVEAIEQLPEGKLGLAYVNTGPLFRTLAGFGAGQVAGGGLPGANPAALQSFAMSVSAEAEGLQFDSATLIDPAMLTPEQRAAMSPGSAANGLLGWVPNDAYAMLVTAGLRQQLEPLLSNPLLAGDPTLSRLGLTGPDGALADLTGEAALTVTPGSGKYPTGAFLLGTNDAQSMQRFLDRLSVLAAEGLGSAGLAGVFESSGPTGEDSFTADELSTSLAATDARTLVEAKKVAVRWERATYRGVSISFLRIPQLEEYGIQPAYAVGDGAGILAASPEAIRDVLDARVGENVTSSQNFVDGQKALGGLEQSLFFIDVERVSEGVREAFPPEGRTFFDLAVAPNLEPIKAVIAGSRSDAERSVSRLILLIP